MPKAQFNSQIHPDTADAVRKLADSTCVNLGDLTDLMLRYALRHMQPEAIRTWARAQERAKEGAGGALRRDERAVLGALERLTVRPVFRLEAEDVAAESGLPQRDAFRALKSLQARGLVQVFSASKDLDKWGRPKSSVWQLEPLPEWAGKPLPPGEG